MDTNKRVILAVSLSLLVLLGWNYVFPPAAPYDAENQTVQTETRGANSEASLGTRQTTLDTPEITGTAFTANQGEHLTVDTPLYRAVINTHGGVLESFALKNYKTSIAPDAENIDLVTRQSMTKAPLGLIWNAQPTWVQGDWNFQGQNLTLTDGQMGAIRLTGTFGGVQMARVFSFTGGTYEIKEELKVTNLTAAQMQGNLAFSMSSASLSAPTDQYNHTRIAYLSAGKLEQESDQDDLRTGLLSAAAAQWGGVESNYFLLALAPTSSDLMVRAKLEDDVYRLTMTDSLLLDPGTTQMRTMSYYLGPKTEKNLAAMPKKLAASINYGFFDIIAKPLNTFLNFLYKYVDNYGVAIIILTILIKVLFWPLSQKSYKSMEQMKKLQPLMAKIREKYADDREKMNAEVMQLYKTYKVNPAGGCVPMLLQIPVFFALYQALLGAIELRHAAFIPHLPFTHLVWLADLSAKDPYYITPLIMGATMFLQQRMSPSMGDPMQAKIMMFMPVIFTFLFLNFPSGLVIYWLVNNLLSIAQQWTMVKKSR